MFRPSLSLAFQCLAFGGAFSLARYAPKCRTQPGDPAFPNKQHFSQLNSSVDGRLLTVVPSAQFCKTRPGGCTDAEWSDSIFRSDIPGAMLDPNWEQDYTSHPPSVCFRNSTTCGHGSVPIYAINATSAAHIQAGVHFAQAYNLKVAIKASGHDYLGRSTAKNSLLLWTRYLDDITFHDSFSVGGKDEGSAVTAGSGVGLFLLYQACKAKGKIFVGGDAANVVAAGGYVQGGGHSPLSPLYGLGADNVLEFEVVIANGSLVTANEVTNPDLFWALRGGGPGSWGVIISATFRTFPNFNVALHQLFIAANTSADMGKLATIHAQHIFDWDNHRASQYSSAPIVPVAGFPAGIAFTTFFPNASAEVANASLAPFVEAAAAQGFATSFNISVTDINDAVAPNTDTNNLNILLGSRLIPADVYRDNPTAIGDTYKRLFDAGVLVIQEFLVAGGRVSENANISSAIHPKWRTAKTQIIFPIIWNDTTPPEDAEGLHEDLTKNKVPILQELAGPGSAAYLNEADVREPKFQTTFYGDYARLSAIKEAYDPKELFIVGAGVGSEKWDAYGLCRVE